MSVSDKKPTASSGSPKIDLLTKWRFACLISWHPALKLKRDVAVALAILDYFNVKKDCAWPSQKALAEKTGLGLNTIRRAIDTLHANGIIVRAAGGGRGHADEYRPN